MRDRKAARTGSAPGRSRRRRPTHPPGHENAIEKRIAAGEEPEVFLCIDCHCWSLDPLYCGCWARAAFPTD